MYLPQDLMDQHVESFGVVDITLERRLLTPETDE
jgi:hypothetical protein